MRHNPNVHTGRQDTQGIRLLMHSTPTATEQRVRLIIARSTILWTIRWCFDSFFFSIYFPHSLPKTPLVSRTEVHL